VSLDYFSFTVPAGDVGGIVREAVAFLGIQSVEDRKRGMFGYRASLDLGGYGLIAYGGEAQRGTVLVSINGEGCRRIADFGRVRSWAESLGARITRLDIAADDYESESLDIPRAIEAWRRVSLRWKASEGAALTISVAAKVALLRWIGKRKAVPGVRQRARRRGVRTR
jgi:hypothetical protein